MLATRETITDFIPQRGAMVMINSLIDADDDHATSQFQIEADTLFVANGLFREAGLVENIAQTAAAHAGFQFIRKDMPVPLGFIASIKDLKIYSLPRMHTLITTGVRITNSVFGVTFMEGRIEQSGYILCTCEMTIFLNTR
jgi:predicted hotdog family 3-hydroxylacyl-ACP dehydratase